MRGFLAELRLYLCNHWVSKIPSHSFRLWFYRNVMKFNIGKASYVLMNCSFDCAEGLIIGNSSTFNANCRIDARGGILIGNNVSISSDVIILTADHDIDKPDMEGRQKKVVIDDYVWIGTRATILPGVHIGYGAVVAAGAVVTRNVSAHQVVAGVPAKVIKERKCKSGYTYQASYKRLLQ